MAKEIDFSKSVYELCSKDAGIIDILAELGFTDILKPGMLNTAGRFMTIPKGAAMKKIDFEKIRQVFINKGYDLAE